MHQIYDSEGTLACLFLNIAKMILKVHKPILASEVTQAEFGKKRETNFVGLGTTSECLKKMFG